MGIFNPIWTKIPEWWQALVCLLIIITCSILFAVIYIRGKRIDGYYKDTPITFIILPTIICGLVMGVTAIAFNISSGQTTDIAARFGRVAVALLSALLILKFRGEERTPEILTYYLFLIVIGFLLGMGYIAFALILYAFIIMLFIGIHLLHFPKISKRRLTLKVTIPEDLNYEHAFDDIFKKYTDVAELVRVRSSDLGTLFILRYEIVLKKNINQKDFLDAVRVRNSNLDIVLVSDKFEVRD